MITPDEQVYSLQRALDELAPFQQCPAQADTQSGVQVKKAMQCLITALGLLTAENE